MPFGVFPLHERLHSTLCLGRSIARGDSQTHIAPQGLNFEKGTATMKFIKDAKKICCRSNFTVTITEKGGGGWERTRWTWTSFVSRYHDPFIFSFLFSSHFSHQCHDLILALHEWSIDNISVNACLQDCIKCIEDKWAHLCPAHYFHIHTHTIATRCFPLRYCLSTWNCCSEITKQFFCISKHHWGSSLRKCINDCRNRMPQCHKVHQ